MKKSGWRLAAAALLFFVWIGYLAYLAATTTQPIVLSRPQFLIADLYVIAQVDADAVAKDQPASDITVKQIMWSANAEDAKRTKIQVKNLKSALRKPEHGWDGWQGAGEYILALTRNKDDANVFQVTPIPRTPGYEGTSGEPGPIYKATPSTRRQLEDLSAQYHPPGK